MSDIAIPRPSIICACYSNQGGEHKRIQQYFEHVREDHWHSTLVIYHPHQLAQFLADAAAGSFQVLIVSNLQKVLPRSIEGLHAQQALKKIHVIDLTERPPLPRPITPWI